MGIVKSLDGKDHHPLRYSIPRCPDRVTIFVQEFHGHLGHVETTVREERLLMGKVVILI